MGQVVAVGIPVIKGKLQHLHTGVARVAEQLSHRGGEETQVLGDNVLFPQAAIHRLKKRNARTGLPDAVFCSLVPIRDGIIGVEAPEVVNAQGVVELELPSDAPQPPGVAVLLHPLPVEQGIAPQLAVGGKVVRGAACNLGGPPVLIQLELVGIGPHVSAVQGHIDGQVPNDGNPLLVGVLLQVPPLGIKEVLHPPPEIHLLPELFPGLFHRLGLPQADVLRPLQPGNSAVSVFQGHEQGVVLQPVRTPEGAPHLKLVPPGQAGTGQTQNVKAVLIEDLVIDPRRVIPPVDILILSGLQKPPLSQNIQINEVGVAGKGGEGLIGGVAVAGGAQRQNLPAGLAPRRQKINKFPRFRPQGPDAAGRRQGRDRHQNACFSHGRIPFPITFCSTKHKRLSGGKRPFG